MALRQAVKNVLAACFALILGAVGCGGGQDDYVIVHSSPTQASRAPEQAVSEATLEQLRACVRQGASRLTGSSHAMKYQVAVNDRGEVQKVEARDSSLADEQTIACIEQVLGAMRVNMQALPMRSSRPFSGGERMMREERAALGNSESQSPIVLLLGPLVAEGVSSTVVLDFVMMLLVVAAVATNPGGEDPKQYCDERYVQCLESALGSEKGDKWKHSRCQWCADVCMREGGVWPSRAPAVGRKSVSCVY